MDNPVVHSGSSLRASASWRAERTYDSVVSQGRPVDVCASCGTEVRPTGENVIGSGFPARDFDTETATCPNCSLPLRRAKGQPWVWAGDAPPWLIRVATKAENWKADAWQQWEKLRERFDEFRVQPEPTDAAVTGIQAYGTNLPFLVERPNPNDDQPVLEALHRLLQKVVEIRQQPNVCPRCGAAITHSGSIGPAAFVGETGEVPQLDRDYAVCTECQTELERPLDSPNMPWSVARR